MNFIYSIKRLFRQSFLSYKALFGYSNLKYYLTFKVISPIFQLSFFVLLAKYTNNSNNLSTYIINNAIILSSFSALFGVGSMMRGERFSGTLKNIILSPCNKFIIFLGRSFMYILDSLTTIFIALLWGIIIFKADFSNINLFMLLLCILISIYSVCSFGLFIGSFGLIIQDINMILNVLNLTLIIFSGTNFPISQLPKCLQFLSYCLPFTRSLQASKIVISNSGENILPLLFSEFLIGSFFLISGFCLFKFLESRSLKQGSLDVY